MVEFVSLLSVADKLFTQRIPMGRTTTGRHARFVLLVALGHADSGRHTGSTVRHEAGVWRGQSGGLRHVPGDADDCVSGLSMADWYSGGAGIDMCRLFFII